MQQRGDQLKDEKYVDEVLEIETLEIQDDSPNRLVISARGRTNSDRWSRPRLVARNHVNPPADGIQEFHFFASPPGSVDTRNTPEIKANGAVDPVPEWLEGVRVLADKNSLERPLD
ncbi:hypothetical protein E5163_05445 [Marinicauda algicola]|uniref:Uncharacterized protein n=1 Tax=Marinicauda algicola TaxID=2029849 RepID=A0A4S2H4L5_9PROT|nr:hypothetical protein [Marinicauda algicola]TGY90566.1 hypothetical protein E5163_05445 [Marinicauda algicola]